MIVEGDILLYEGNEDKLLGIVVVPRTKAARNYSYEIHDMHWIWCNNPEGYELHVGRARRIGDQYMKRIGNLRDLGVDLEDYLAHAPRVSDDLTY